MALILSFVLPAMLLASVGVFIYRVADADRSYREEPERPRAFWTGPAPPVRLLVAGVAAFTFGVASPFMCLPPPGTQRGRPPRPDELPGMYRQNYDPQRFIRLNHDHTYTVDAPGMWCLPESGGRWEITSCAKHWCELRLTQATGHWDSSVQISTYGPTNYIECTDYPSFIKAPDDQ